MDDSIGSVFPDDPYIFGWTGNLPYALGLAARMGIARAELPKTTFNFPAGTMFWARTRALAALLNSVFPGTITLPNRFHVTEACSRHREDLAYRSGESRFSQCRDTCSPSLPITTSAKPIYIQQSNPHIS